jgi:hexokinase
MDGRLLQFCKEVQAKEVEGTTSYKLHNFRSRFENYLNEYLTDDRKRYVEFTEVAHSSLIGAALAALTD